MARVYDTNLLLAGKCPITDVQIFSPETVQFCLTIMSSCGMYDASGAFCFKMGFPAKSGQGHAFHHSLITVYFSLHSLVLCILFSSHIVQLIYRVVFSLHISRWLICEHLHDINVSLEPTAMTCRLQLRFYQADMCIRCRRLVAACNPKCDGHLHLVAEARHQR